MEKETKAQFRYEQDSKRFHRFRIESDEGIVGTIYISKDMAKDGIPERITLERVK